MIMIANKNLVADSAEMFAKYKITAAKIIANNNTIIPNGTTRDIEAFLFGYKKKMSIDVIANSIKNIMQRIDTSTTGAQILSSYPVRNCFVPLYARSHKAA